LLVRVLAPGRTVVGHFGAARVANFDAGPRASCHSALLLVGKSTRRPV